MTKLRNSLTLDGSEMSILSGQFAQYASSVIDAALALRAPPVPDPSLNRQMDSLARLGRDPATRSAGWPLDRYFIATRPPAPDPVSRVALSAWAEPSLADRIKGRVGPHHGAAENTATLCDFVAGMGTASGRFQLDTALRIRAFLADRVVLTGDAAPVPVIHPNSFVVAYGLADARGTVARGVAGVATRASAPPTWLGKLTGRLSRDAPAPTPDTPADTGPPPVRAATDKLSGGGWMTFWDWWLLERLARKLPRRNAAPVLTEIDRIAAYLGQPDPDQRPDALHPDWDGRAPEFLNYFEEDR